MSLLIFGLGAAALLRAAHESFASNPSWRGAPETLFVQRNDATPPMLAMLRVQPIEKASVERTSIEKATSEKAPMEKAQSDAIAPPAMEPLGATVPATSETAATPDVVLNPADAAAPANANQEIAKTEDPAAEVPVPESAHAAETTPPLPEAPRVEVTAAEIAKVGAPTAIETKATESKTTESKLDETKTTAAAATEVASSESAPAAAAPDPLDRSEAPETIIAATKIATLGGPPVEIAEPAAADEARTAKSDSAKTDQAEAKKREQARRELRRRRLAAQARLAAQRQLQANPFGQQQPYLQQQALPQRQAVRSQ